MAAKVKAGDLFTDSILFDAEIIKGKPENSAFSSGVQFKLTCKECGEVQYKTGNSKNLCKCTKCKREWDPEENAIVGDKHAEVVVPNTTRVAVAEPLVEILNDDPVVKAPKRRGNIKDKMVDVIINSANEYTATQAEPIDRDVYVVESIIDYYDERLADRWHRIYLVQWVGYKKPTFVNDNDFTDKNFVNSFEESLPEHERFDVMFPKSKLRLKGTKHAHRMKIDVIKDQTLVDSDDEIVEVPATTTTTTTATTTLDDIDTETRTFTYIKLKKGQVYKIGDVIIEAV